MTAFTLRLIALISMLFDHIGYCFGISPLRLIGRLAFPLYVYLIVNGYRHTRNRVRYALRLGVMAIVSQIPFSLFESGKILQLKCNVMVTLLLILLTVWGTDVLAKTHFAPCPAVVFFLITYFGMIKCDYGCRGILLALVFWYFEDKPVLLWLGTFVSIMFYYLLSIAKFCALFLLGRGGVFPMPDTWGFVQLFALLSLPLIQLYNGKRGYAPKSPVAAKALQYGFYWFYPVHLLILYFIASLIK